MAGNCATKRFSSAETSCNYFAYLFQYTNFILPGSINYNLQFPFATIYNIT